MTEEITNLFKGQTFYLTSDPLIKATRGKSPVHGAPYVPISEAVRMYGGEVAASFDRATCVVISPLKEVPIEQYSKKPVYGSKYIEDSIELFRPLAHTVPSMRKDFYGISDSDDDDASKESKNEKEYVYKPILCRAFEDTKVSIYSRFQSDLKDSIENVLSLMGHYKNSECKDKYLITDVANSAETYAAATSGSKIVKCEWIFDSFKAQEMLPLVAKYVVKPFENCVICVTGFLLVSRQIIQQIVVSMGGVFSPEFSKKCTHLIAHNTSSPKFKASQCWGIPAVKLDWLFLAVNQKACPPAIGYVIQQQLPGSTVFLNQNPVSLSSSLIQPRPIFIPKQVAASKRNDSTLPLARPPAKKSKPDDGKGDDNNNNNTNNNNNNNGNNNNNSNANNDNSKKPSDGK